MSLLVQYIVNEFAEQPMNVFGEAKGPFTNTAVAWLMEYQSNGTLFLAPFVFRTIIATAAMYMIWRVGSDAVAILSQSVVLAFEGRYFLDTILLFSFRTGRDYRLSKDEARKYVSRPALEDEIRSYMGPGALKPNGQYLVLYGALGTGKSMCVRFLAHSVRGEVMILVTQTTTEHTIMETIARAALFKDMMFADFLTAMQRCTERLAGNPYPVIVFDIVGDVSDGKALALVSRMSKHLSLYCHVIVILSDPHAALVFNTDPLRQMYLCVEEPTSAEAAEMCAKLSPPMPATEQELGRVFAQLGTRPTMLIDLHWQLVLKKTTVDQYIKRSLQRALNTLHAFPHQQLILALIISPCGVRLSVLRDMRDSGVPLHDPHLVAPAIKRSEAVLYDIERGEYRLQSRTLATALSSAPYQFPCGD